MRESNVDICLHRFHDCVSMSAIGEGTGKTVYLSADRARALAAGLLEAADNIATHPDFCTAHFGRRSYPAGNPALVQTRGPDGNSVLKQEK